MALQLPHKILGFGTVSDGATVSWSGNSRALERAGEYQSCSALFMKSVPLSAGFRGNSLPRTFWSGKSLPHAKQVTCLRLSLAKIL
jgi:hypothetical protein